MQVETSGIALETEMLNTGEVFNGRETPDKMKATIT